MGGAAALIEDRRQRTAAQDQPGRGPRRQVGPVREPEGDGGGIRLHPVAVGRGRLTGRFALTFTAEPAHIDMMGHVNNAVWVQWMEAIATAHWEAVALPKHQAAYGWVVS